MTEHHFHFSSAASFFLEVFFCSSTVAYGPRAHLLVPYLFAFSYCSGDFWGKNTGVSCHSFLWTTFCQNSPLWLVCLGWPCMAWLIASLSYSSPFSMTRQWSMKGIHVYRFPYSGLSYEWTHIVCGFCGWLCLLCVIFSGFKFHLYFIVYW